jgi:UPF0176 protein
MNNVMAFYQFAPLSELDRLRAALAAKAESLDIKGTVLIAEEGVNGTLAGAESDLKAFADQLKQVQGLEKMPFKFSSAQPGNRVFYRLKVRIKAEIVALGQPGVNPAMKTGTHVDPETFNELLDDPDVVVIDTRNRYEIAIGTFPGAVDPATRSFKQFPDFVAGLDPLEQPRVAMFCTGGIRCEKASAYLLDRGFDEVYQLDGGILKYLETVTPERNRWQGECFVFDQRVSVDADLSEGSYVQCFACRSALDEVDLASKDYQVGVSCPNCIGEQEASRRASFQERQRQVELARSRGEQHVGKRMENR